MADKWFTDTEMLKQKACTVLTSIIFTDEIPMVVSDKIQVALTLLEPQKEDDVIDALIQANKIADAFCVAMEETIKHLEDDKEAGV